MNTSATTSTPKQGEVPQYRLTEPAYINDVFYDQHQVDSGKAIIFWEDPPGHHMLPLNAAAREMVKRYKPVKMDPLAALTQVTQPAPESAPVIAGPLVAPPVVD